MTVGNVVNLDAALSRVTDYWSPKVIGRVNDQFLKAAKVKGEFVWHQHDDEDELFLVLRGRLTIQLRDGDVTLGPGEFYVVPKGTPHNPRAEDECWLVLVETVSTKHTGEVDSPLTRSVEEQLS